MKALVIHNGDVGKIHCRVDDEEGSDEAVEDLYSATVSPLQQREIIFGAACAGLRPDTSGLGMTVLNPFTPGHPEEIRMQNNTTGLGSYFSEAGSGSS